MFMDSLETAGYLMEDLLNFSSDIGEDNDDEDLTTKKTSKPFSSLDPLPELAEEELEWISNKDAFPAVETFLDIGTLSKRHSPVSVLENSSNSTGSGGSSGGGIIIMNYCGSLRVPVKARSKCLKRRRRDITAQQCWWSQENLKSAKPVAATIGRKCQHCGAEKTPQWRAGPLGPKTLCNACGVRFKSGRLVPEYRPASSPTFSSELHSNSHRKVLEMRRQKQMMGLVVAKPTEKG